MNPIEKDLMMGMVAILNESSNLLTEEQINIRLADLKQFEDETNFMFVNSPNCPIDLKSTVEATVDYKNNYIECNNIEDIIEFSNDKEMLVYVNYSGVDMLITYTDGVISKIGIDNMLVDIKKIENIPYKINKEGTYIVQGKVVPTMDRIKFFVHNIVTNDNMTEKDSLDEAKDLWFDIAPKWLAGNLSPKNLQSNIDYVIENYIEDDETPSNGVVFKFNDSRDNKAIMYVKSE